MLITWDHIWSVWSVCDQWGLALWSSTNLMVFRFKETCRRHTGKNTGTWKDKRSHFGFSRGRNNWGKSAFLSLHILEILYFWSTTADMQGPQVIPYTAARSVSYSNNTGLLNKMDKCNIFISNKFIRIVLLIIFIFITKHQFLRYFFYWDMNTLKKTKYI